MAEFDPVSYSKANKVAAQMAELSNNVRSFGAKGDGVTDDTAAFEAAEAALPATGGTIFVPTGTYIVSYRIRKANVKLVGAGWGAILKTPPNATKLINDCPLRIFADNCTVRDLKIDGNSENNTHLNTMELAREADGIGIYSNYNTIENVWVHGVRGHHIIVWNESFADESHPAGARHHNSIRYCLVTGKGLRNMVDLASTMELGDNYDQNINYCNEIIGNKVLGNIVVHTGWETLVQGNMCESIGVHTGSRSVIIKDNIIKGGGGIFVQGGLSTASTEEVRRSRNIIIDGNEVYEPTNAAGIAGENIDGLTITNNTVRSPVREGILYKTCSDILIKGNRILNAGTHGISQSGITTTCSRLIIDNNLIKSPAEFAIVTYSITDSQISRNTFIGGKRAIDMRNSSLPITNIKINDNICLDQSQYGFILYGTDLTVSNNKIDRCGGWAFFAYSEDTTFENNVVRNSIGSIRFDSTATCSGAIIKNNILDNTTSSAINSHKDDTIIKHNVINGVWVDTGRVNP